MRLSSGKLSLVDNLSADKAFFSHPPREKKQENDDSDVATSVNYGVAHFRVDLSLYVIPKWALRTRRKLVHFNLGHRDSWVGKCINKSIWLAPGRYPWCTHGRCPPVANQIDLFMHFLGASRDGLVARPVEMDELSSSDEN